MALETKFFQSQILGLPVSMYAVVMFLCTVWESHGVFYFRSRLLCFKRPNLIKNPMSSEPFVSSTKALPAKRSEKGYGDENVGLTGSLIQTRFKG